MVVVVRGIPAWFMIGLLLSLSAFTSAQESAYFEQTGVTYYGAIGTVESGNMTRGIDHTGESTEDFTGCVWAKLRPDVDRGILRMVGRLNGVPISLDASNFYGHREDMQDGIAELLEVDGSRMHGSIQHPRVLATAAAWGEGRLYVNDVPLNDPVTGNPYVGVTWFVTETGFRDDATGQILDVDGGPYQPGDPAIRTQGDWEVHLRVESMGNNRAPPVTNEYERPPAATGFDYFTDASDYRETFKIRNERFGGNGSLTLRAESLAQQGDTQMVVRVFDPAGAIVAQGDVAPYLNTDDSVLLAFDLLHFGNYIVEVTGSLSLARYDLEMVQTPGERLDLDFWWEDMAFGYDTGEPFQVCQETVGGAALPVSGTVPPRPQPPAFPLFIVVMTTVAVIAGVLAAVKFTMMARAAAKHAAITKS